MKDFQLMVKLYGVRGSYPIAPEKGTKYGGNTTCLLARTKNQIVIIDAGSGIIKLGKELIPEILEHNKNTGQSFRITILFTHTHYDHLLGLPFFAPVYMPDVHIDFIGPATLGVDFEEILRKTVTPQYFPVSMDEFRSSKNFHNGLHRRSRPGRRRRTCARRGRRRRIRGFASIRADLRRCANTRCPSPPASSAS